MYRETLFNVFVCKDKFFGSEKNGYLSHFVKKICTFREPFPELFSVKEMLSAICTPLSSLVITLKLRIAPLAQLTLISSRVI